MVDASEDAFLLVAAYLINIGSPVNLGGLILLHYDLQFNFYYYFLSGSRHLTNM